MDTGETERLPADLQILAAAIVFTLVSYAVFRGMWGIHVPILFLLAVLVVQAATVFLGDRGLLTSMGAASVSVLLSVSAYFAAVYYLFPVDAITRYAGIAGGTASAVFILTSSITSFRAGAFDMEGIEELQISVKESEDLFEFDAEPEPGLDLSDLREGPLEQAEEVIVLDDPIDLSDGLETLKAAGDRERGVGISGKQPDDVSTAVTARGEGVSEGGPSRPERAARFDLRPRYRVIEASTGTPLGTYYSDEGYSSIDPVTLSALLDEKTRGGEMRIVNLDWSNFDEVEVQVERTPVPSEAWQDRPELPDDPAGPAEQGFDSAGLSDGGPGEKKGLPEGVTELKDGTIHEDAQRYVIYERRTMSPLGEYVPTGDRPRIDRLTLYRMFPEYDYRSFQIDSIRWLEGEVGIFIKGEKKGRK